MKTIGYAVVGTGYFGAELARIILGFSTESRSNGKMNILTEKPFNEFH